MELNFSYNSFISCYMDRRFSFSRVDVCVGAKSQMFLESHCDDWFDCDDKRKIIFAAAGVGAAYDDDDYNNTSNARLCMHMHVRRLCMLLWNAV